MKRKGYPRYKDSGIEWLGEIPVHWGNLKIGRLGTLRNGLNKDKSAYGTGARYVTVNDLYEEGYIDQENLKRMEVTLQEFNQYSLIEHDILFARSSVKREGVGSPGIIGKIQEETVFSGFVIRLRVTNTKAIKKYIYWLLRSKSLRDIVVAVSNTVAQTNLSQPNLKTIEICLPSMNEQNFISSFLDRETSRIDRLMEKKEKQVELLKEKRAALISHAVTKGLDPQVKMKDSGIEWLGEIPEHWEAIRLKYLSERIGSGKTPRGGSEVYTDSGIVLLRSQNIHFDRIRLEEAVFIDKKTNEEMSSTKVYPYDILLNITGASLGRCCIAPLDIPPSNVNQHVCIIRPIQTKVHPDFLWLVICSGLVQSQIFATETGSSREGLNFQQVGNIIINLPMSLNEQKSISLYLNEKISKIDKIIGKVIVSIDKLKEYRTALISAAVTGKIDVGDSI